MTTPSADHFNARELAQLMHFYAETGVEWLLEEAPVDRFAEFVELEAQRTAPMRSPQSSPKVLQRQAPVDKPPVPQRQAIAVPDAEAVAEAVRIAAQATTLAELAEAVIGFTGCNLRNSARNVAFLSGSATARIAIAGGVPGADDDRDGAPFSGASGAMLARMLAGIGIAPADVLLFNLVPWRPPGNRAPTQHESDICRPFTLRLLEILKPAAVLALGNYPAKTLSGSAEGIHALRGKRIEIDVGGEKIPMLATFHPQDIIATPLNKRLVWQDLLAFRAEITG
jgi:uracil-DNA glycosylase family 4